MRVRATTAIAAVLAGTVLIGCSTGAGDERSGSDQRGTAEQQTAAQQGAAHGARPDPSGAASADNDSALVPDDEGVLLGAWVKPQPGQSPVEAVDTFQEQVGRQLDIVHSFYPWEAEFPTERDHKALAQGSTPLISWNGTFTDNILSGRQDQLIVERAHAVRDLVEPVFLRWFWEPENKNGQEFHDGPADYIAAWKYVRGIFDREGVDNAVWVWCPTSFGFTQGTAQPFYPGDDSVDWICADGYSGDPDKRGGKRRQFVDVFRAFYDWAVPHDKPIMIAEFGVHGAGAEQAQWLQESAEVLRQQYPQIRAIVYFDSPDKGDWTLRDEPAALEAFGSLADDPYFNTREMPALS